jgi:phosphoglycerate dehydrogenase-like enzyme
MNPAELVDKNHPKLSIRQQCELLSVSRSTLSYKPVEQSEEDRTLMKILDEIYMKDPCIGSRRLPEILERDYAIKANRKRIQRLRHQMGIETIWCRPRHTSIPDKMHRKYPYLLRERNVQWADEVWCADITYVPMPHGHAHLCAVMDWRSRKVLGWAISNTMDSTRTEKALTSAVARCRSLPEIFNTDQGSQFTSPEWTGRLDAPLQHLASAPALGQPNPGACLRDESQTSHADGRNKAGRMKTKMWNLPRRYNLEKCVGSSRVGCYDGTPMSLKTVILCSEWKRPFVFPASVVEEIGKYGETSGGIIDPKNWKDELDRLRSAEVIIGTWGLPRMDSEFLAATPCLRAVLYAAGSVKGFVTDALWSRGISVSSAAAANGIPVAEFTVAAILLSLKRFWHFARGMRLPGGISSDSVGVPGGYHSKVGIVSMGIIGRTVAERLSGLDVELFAYDPFVACGRTADAKVRMIGLAELFAECDVVSVHAPLIPETEGLIGRKLISSMKPGATLINTARGAILVEQDLCEVLAERPDLSAVLDVTHPEPTAPDSPLRSLPNVMLTPHIAGSIQTECARMGMWMAEELARLSAGEPLRHQVTRELLHRIA